MLPAVVRTLNSPEGIKQFLAVVPATIEQALDRPPVSELIRAGAKKNMLEACLAAEIVKASNMLAVGGNLREGQALEIAIQLIADFPNESLEDFCLCLRRGTKGLYGEIFRFDVLVINNWMKGYIDDKYKVLEDRLRKEKEAYKDQYYWKANTLTDEVKNQQIKERLAAWEAAVDAIPTKPVIPLEDNEITKDGKRKQAAYQATHGAEYYELQDKIRRAASEFYKDRHNYSEMKLWPVGEHQVFAESQEDAVTIYNQVNFEIKK